MTTNYERAFAEHPAVYAAWQQLIAAIKVDVDLRRYELITLAAARALKSSYCSLAHGTILRDKLAAPVAAIARDRRAAGLAPVEVAIMDLAETVVRDATAVTAADRDRLRGLGLSDREIMDVILTATARCFFSKTLDALGVLPDAAYQAMEQELRDLLVVGRPIAAS